MRSRYPKGKVLRWVQYSALPFHPCDLLMPHKPQNQVKICCSKTEKVSRGFSSLTEIRRNRSSCILFLECLRSQVEGKRRGMKITLSPPWYTLRCTTCGAERCWESRCCGTEGLSRAVSSFLLEREMNIIAQSTSRWGPLANTRWCQRKAPKRWRDSTGLCPAKPKNQPQMCSIPAWWLATDLTIYPNLEKLIFEIGEYHAETLYTTHMASLHF